MDPSKISGFGDGNTGGTLIDLVLKLNPGYGVSEAFREISSVIGSSFSLLQPVVSGTDTPEKEPSGITIIKRIVPNGKSDYINISPYAFT